MRNFFFILKSLCGGKSANTPPTRFSHASHGIIPAFLKPLALILLFVLGSVNVWGADETLTNNEIKTNITSTQCAYGTARTPYVDGDVTYTACCNTDAAGRPWMQMRAKNDAYILITVPSTKKITNVSLTISNATNSKGGITDISKHGNFSGEVVLREEVSNNPGTSPTCTSGSVNAQSASVSVTGTYSSLYLQTTAAARIWEIVVTYENAVSCSNKVTLAKGSETNGTFSLNKSDGSYDNCDENFVVTVSDISAYTGYYCSGVTATGGNSEITGPDGSGNYTVTYTNGNNITSTITANFAPKTARTVTFMNNGAQYGDVRNLYDGDAVGTLPSAPSSCKVGKVFVGWSETNIGVTPTDDAPSFISASTVVSGSDKVYHAVFATATPGEDEILSQTLSYDTWTYSGSASDQNTYRLFGNDAYVESASFDLSTLSKVVVYGGTYGGDTYNSLTIGDGTNTWKSVTVTGKSATGENEYTGGTALSGNGTLRIKSNSGNGSSNGVRISQVKIYTIPNVYSGYFTECCTELASIAEQVSMEQTKATLTWDAIEGVTTWSVTGNVKNGAAITSGIGAITDAAGNKKQCIITGLTPATQYEFQIHATSFSTGYCTDVDQWDLSGTTDAAFTITAESNDNTLGTVSLVGNVITGEPAENCRYASPAFTISPANSATVVQNGNEFTVTPTASTMVTINFEAIPSHTVTWNANGSETTDNFFEGADIVFPNTASGCAGKVFKGWVASPIDGETDTEPSYVTAATMSTNNVTYYAVFAKETTNKVAGNPIQVDGTGGQDALSALEGVTVSGLGSDYTNHSPYLAKFDDTNDYIQFDLDEVPTSVYFAYKMIGGNSTSTMTIKECETVNGEYTDVQAFSISGAQNSTGEFTTSNSFSQKHVRMVFTKGSNVGVGAITVSGYIAGAPTYSKYATTCTPQVATPTFSGVTPGEDCNEVKSVTISSETDDASIYYTTNGDDPTTGSTLYEGAITLAGGTHTIKAIAVKAGMDDSEIASITFTQPYRNIAEFIAADPSSAKKLVVTDAVVLGATDKYIYIQDATGGIQLYKNSHELTFASGKTLSGFVAGTYSNNSTSAYMPRLTFSDGSTMSVTEDAPALPDPVVITAGSEANICKLVKLRNVKFQSTALSSNTVYVEKEGGDIDTVYNTFNVLDKSLPNSATLCDVTGVLIKHSQKYEIAPVSVDGITTNGALAILPTLSVTGSTDSDNPTAVAEGKVITITPADGMTSTLKDGDAAATEFDDETNVTINADKSITVSASAYYYTENSATYYYHVDPSLTEHAISKASMSNGSVTIKNGGDEVSSAVADATITLLVTPSTHYHMSTISVTDEDEGNVDVTEVIAGEQYTFKMPAKAVTVNATFAEDAYAVVTFAKGDESATGTAPSSFKKYVGQEAIMPANTFTLSGNSFTGWKYGDDTYDVSAGYTILAQDAEIGGKTITFEAQWEPYPWAGNGKWELVTDASELVTSPKMYIIFAKNNKAGGAQSNNYRVLEDVTIADGLLTWTGVDPAVFTLESGNVENTFAFADAANGGYLNANGTGNNNYLTTTASKAYNNASWGIESINAETGEAVIKAKSSNRNMLSINTQNSRFSAYGQAQAGLQVFKFVAGSYFNINYAKGVEVEEEDNVSNMPTTQVTASDGTATLSDKVPVYVGYVFEGWKLDENTTYQPNDIVGPLSQNITLTAQWTAAEKHMLSYDKNGGEGDVDVDTEYYPNDVVTLAGALTKDGLIFAGWEYDGNVYAAGAQFTMPDQNVVMTAKFAQGAVYTFPGTNAGTTTVAGAPEGSTFTFTNGGNYNSGQVQLTGNSGNTMTLTLSGYDLYTIKAITLNMRSNGSAGAGTFSATINGNTVAELANATDFDEWFDNTTFGATNRDVHVAITPVRVQSGQDIVITLTGTTNSIYIKSVTIEYELILDVIRDNLSEGKWGTICPDHRINYPTGASFYTLTYLQMEAGMPYKLFFDEVETDYLEAGKPYLFIAEGEAIKGIKVGDKVTTAANYNGFYGNVSGSTNTISTSQTEYQASGDIVNYYGLKNNTFTLLGNGTAVANERAVVQIKNGQLNCSNPPLHLAPARPGVRRVVASNSAPQIATGVDELNASETPVKMMIDGQLFILRGEKMYDATGRLVK